MRSKKEAQKQSKRRSILETAPHLFPRKEYEQTCIEELAREAGIGTGTVYSYFSTKWDIVRAFCEDQMKFVRAEITANTNQESSLREQLKIIFMAEFRHVIRNKEFFRLYPVFQRAKDHWELRSELELLHISGHFHSLYLLIMSCWYTGMIPTDGREETMETLLAETIEGLSP